MKKLIATILCALTVGCSSINDMTVSQSAVVGLAIKAGTIDLINKDPINAKATAATVLKIANGAIGVVGGGTVSAVSELSTRLDMRIAELNLSPEKQVLVDTLVFLVKAELQTQIADNVLDERTVVVITKALKVIAETAAYYD